MSHELQRLLGIAAIMLAIGVGVGACELGIGYGAAKRLSAERALVAQPDRAQDF